MARPGLVHLGPPRGAGTNYVFRGCGNIDPGPVDGFGGMLVVPVPPETIVFGTVADPDKLAGIMSGLESRGLRVDSVHRVRELPPSPDPFAAGSSRKRVVRRGE